MAASAIVSLSYPKPRDTYTKFVKVVATDLTAFIGCWLPKDAMIVGIYVIGQAVNTAVTSASLGIGTTSAANELVSGYDLKTAATGEGYNAVGAAAVGSAFGVRLTADTPIYFDITSAGGSDGGGPWYVKIEYVIPGPGENIVM